MSTERNRERLPNPLNRPNPFDAIVPALAGPAPEAQRLAPGAGVSAGQMWGRVVSVDPLRVVVPPGTSASDTTPVSLVPLSDLAPGVAVRVEWQGRTFVIRDRVWTASDPDRPQPLPLSSPWVRYQPSFGAPTYTVRGGRVHLGGLVGGGQGGQATPVATLPPSARPSTNRIVTAIDGNAFTTLQISPSGAMWIRVDSGPVSWLSLDGVSYDL